MAMAAAVRMDSAARLRPEMMSPAMISRMALVKETPGTSIIRMQGGQRAAEGGAEKAVGTDEAAPVQQTDPDGQTAGHSGQRVGHAAAEQRRKEGGGDPVAHQHLPGGILGGALHRGGQQLLGLVHRGGLGAELAAQGVAPLQQLNVCAVAANAAHPGDGVALRRGDADDHTVWDGEHLRGLQPVGLKQPAHRLLHPVDLRSAGHQLAAQLHRDIQQLVIIHGVPSRCSRIQRFAPEYNP